MTDEEVAVELEGLSHEIGSLKHRVKTLEDEHKTITTLTSSVNELAINMRYMVEEQKKQGERLQKLESAPLKTATKIKDEFIKAIISVVVGAIIGAFITLILK